MVTARVKVLCERIMSRGYEPRVARLMENVKETVRVQPGFISIDTYAQVDDHTKYVVFSEVFSPTSSEVAIPIPNVPCGLFC